MRIVAITHVVPLTFNRGGTSALPYHLMKYRPLDVELIIYTFNVNCVEQSEIDQVSKDLHAYIRIMKYPWWGRHADKLTAARILIPYPYSNYLKVPNGVVAEINALKPDGVWIYPEEFSRISNQFTGFKRVHLFPDCESLYYRRMLQQRFVQENKILYWRNRIMWPKYRRMERRMEDDPSVRYHLVGQADVEEFNTINPRAQAHFIRHPHYDVAEPAKEIRFARPRIRLVVAGRHDLYMTQTADEVTDALCQASDLQQLYVITFLGKGWEYTAARLIQNGYEVSIVPYAPDYKAELVRHDIQLTPITIGTGTKGKVLDALANGLLVIGTPYAMENIAVTDGESCRTFDTAQQCLEILRDIPDNIKKYEAIAEQGRQAVLRNHGRDAIAKQFFNLFRL